MPSKPDKRTVFYASRSYFPELLDAGVKIYEYEKGFLHSKVVIVDSDLASIGTANMDMRSFHLNFEVNAFLYDTDSIRKLVQDFKDDLEESSEIHVDRFHKGVCIEELLNQRIGYYRHYYKEMSEIGTSLFKKFVINCRI